MTKHETWEIVAGDFGGSYKATAPGLNLSDCTASIKVWKGATLLIDGETCSDVTYDDTDSHCYYTVKDGDFPLSTAVERKRTNYKVMIEFVKDGFKEHDLGFEWIVVPAPPSS